MVEIGETSRAREGEFTDIPVDTEHLHRTEPVEAAVLAPSDSEGDDFPDVPLPEPIRGGVLRAGISSDDSEPEEDSVPESDPEEIIPEALGEEVDPPVSPVYHPVFPVFQSAIYPDGMGSTADDIIEGMTAHQEQLEARIDQLEGENQVHQQREDQYRDLAYQTLGERDDLTEQLAARDQQIATLQGQLQLGQSSADRIDSLVHRVVARSASVSQQLAHTEVEIAGLHEQMAAVRARSARESAYRARMEQDLIRSERRVQMLEAELRRRDSRTDTFDFALTTTLGRLRRRVFDRVARRELRRAVRHSQW